MVYRLTVILFLFTALISLAFSARNPHVVLETNLGNITVELYPEDAPITVDNFLGYINSGFYDYLLFHRIISGFMIQGGGYYYYDGGFYPAPKENPIVNESYNGLLNLRGTIAMARTSEPDSATTEFFINHIDNPFLDRENAEDDYGYCVFGRVVNGMDVVDAIAQVPVTQYYQQAPFPVIYFEALPAESWIGITSAYVLPCGISYCSDLASDSRIAFEDFAVFSSQWLDVCGSDNDFCDGSDLNFSGAVDVVDLELFLDHWTRTAGYEPVFSDLDPNGDIDASDLSMLMTHWLDSGCNEGNDFCGYADIDHSGTVDFTDFSLFSHNWLVTY